MANVQRNRHVNTEAFNEWMDSKGMKSGFLAGCLGITRQAFYNKRRGLTQFTIEDLRLLKAAGMSPDWMDKIFGLTI